MAELGFTLKFYGLLPLLILQDFVHHFDVLLPKEPKPTREGIQGCLDQLDLEPDGYQVGKTMVGTLTLFFSVVLNSTIPFNVIY